MTDSNMNDYWNKVNALGEPIVEEDSQQDVKQGKFSIVSQRDLSKMSAKELKEFADKKAEHEQAEQKKVNDELALSLPKLEKKLHQLKIDYGNINYLENRQLKLPQICRHLMNEITLAKIHGKLHYYDEDKGIYIHDEEQIYLKRCMRAMFPDVRNIHKKEILSYLHEETENYYESPTRYIHVKNGIIDTQKREFLNFTPEIVSTTTLTAPYLPDNKITRLDEVLEDIVKFNDLGDGLFFKQILGQVIYPKILVKKGIMLSGVEGSAKTTLILMMQTLLNPEDFTTMTISQLSEKFGTARLKGKLANLCVELGTGTITESSVYKASVEGSRLEGQLKGVDGEDFYPFATQVFACNNRPEFADKSGAIFDRWAIVPFIHKIRGTDMEDDSLHDNIKENELWKSHILNWALEGLYSLFDTKLEIGKYQYAEPLKVVEENSIYRNEKDSVANFLSMNEIDNKLTGLTQDDAYNLYSSWCKENGIKKKVDSPEFTTRVKNQGYDHKRVGTHPNRYWIYFKLDNFD